MASKKKAKSPVSALKKFALALPGAYEDHPWGESVAKVAKKVFVFFGHDADENFGMSVKLPQTKHEALSLPYAEPTGYGLGKSGWVSFDLGKAKTPPSVDLLAEWIEESYRAVAPKKMLAELEGRRLEGMAAEKAKPAPAKKAKKKR